MQKSRVGRLQLPHSLFHIFFSRVYSVGLERLSPNNKFLFENICKTKLMVIFLSDQFFLFWTAFRLHFSKVFKKPQKSMIENKKIKKHRFIDFSEKNFEWLIQNVKLLESLFLDLVNITEDYKVCFHNRENNHLYKLKFNP